MNMTKRIKLSGMMFLQFMMVAVFFVPLIKYVDALGITGTMLATIMGTMAFGSLLSPLVCMIADRFFNSEKVLLVLNLLVGLFLYLATTATDNTQFAVYMFLAMFSYMPTWGITSNIAIANSTPEAFPTIRVWGSIGWVASALFALSADYFFGVKMFEGTVLPFYCAIGVAIASVILAFTLPATPPPAKGKPMSIIDALGLRAIVLLKDKNFAVLIFSTMLVMIPFVIYWLFFPQFLSAKGLDKSTVAMSLGQISEMVFIALLPLAMRIFGIKWAMALGILAMVYRYFACNFSAGMDENALLFSAIGVHGIIFGFFFVGAQVYIGEKAPKELQAQAQGFLFFAQFGIAQIIGTYFTKWLIDANTVSGAIDWKNIFNIETFISIGVLIFFVIFFNSKGKKIEVK